MVGLAAMVEGGAAGHSTAVGAGGPPAGRSPGEDQGPLLVGGDVGYRLDGGVALRAATINAVVSGRRAAHAVA